jgi:hypothetical protein
VRRHIHAYIGALATSHPQGQPWKSERARELLDDIIASSLVIKPLMSPDERDKL